MNYTYRPVGEGTVREGMEQPLFYYLPSIAVSPIAIYHGAMFPEWEGDLLVGALKGQAVSKLDLVDGRIQSEYQILGELNARVRDIKVASDGALWLLLESGSLYRLARDTGQSPAALQAGSAMASRSTWPRVPPVTAGICRVSRAWGAGRLA